MKLVPIEFSDDAHFWVSRVLSQFESPESTVAGREIRFEPPEEPDWAILLADELIERFSLRDLCAGDSNSKSVFDQLIQSVSGWFQSALYQSDLMQADHHRLTRLCIAKQSIEIYRQIHGQGVSRCEGQLLRNVFASGESVAIRVVVDLLLTQPPVDWVDISLAMSPLLQTDRWQIDEIFPMLLEASNPAVLATAIDLANHSFRKRKLDLHPGINKFDYLLQLLGGTVRQLEMLEENPARFASSVEAIQRILFDSVSLCVSLCDYFALVQDDRAIAKLTLALDLKHRRIKTEAAFALASLGESRAEDVLCSLVSDDACRRRVLAYANELGIESKIDPEWTTSLALARSDLALWLSQRENFSITPSSIELIEQRTLHWPGFESLQECFLFRFRYGFGTEQYTNLAISGPTVLVHSEDLTWLSNDDAFAVYFSRDIDHEEACEIPVAFLSSLQWSRARSLVKELEQLGYDSIAVLGLSQLFEYSAIVAYATCEGKTMTIAFDGDEPQVYVNQITFELAAALWRGRLAMSVFND